MKSDTLIEFEKQILDKEEADKDWLFNVARIVFDQMRLVELKEETELINGRMYKDDRANYALEVPLISDEEIHFAANVIQGRLRVLGEKVPRRGKEKPKEI